MRCEQNRVLNLSIMPPTDEINSKIEISCWYLPQGRHVRDWLLHCCCCYCCENILLYLSLPIPSLCPFYLFHLYPCLCLFYHCFDRPVYHLSFCRPFDHPYGTLYLYCPDPLLLHSCPIPGCVRYSYYCYLYSRPLPVMTEMVLT